MFRLIFILLYISILKSHNCEETKVKNATSHAGKKKNTLLIDLRERDKEYDIRSNIFMDKDRLLGTDKDKEKHGPDYTYSSGPNGPSHWAKSYPHCGGKKQSPINIDLPSLKRLDLPKLRWSEHYEKLPVDMTVVNNRHSIILNVRYDHEGLPNIDGGPLHQPYLLYEVHFHWGSNDHHGSEHMINKKSFPMEMHVVHYRSDLNRTSFIGAEKAVCVVGYIFEVANDCNEAISSLLTAYDRLTMDYNSLISLTNMFRLSELMDTFQKEYVTYAGSLTSPPCSENVIWIISPYTLTISKKQIEKFRIIGTSTRRITDNFRPLQPLNGRVVNFVN